MRKLRTQRDNQQWMLDLALNMRGRVQNFEREVEHPLLVISLRSELAHLRPPPPDNA